MYRSEPIPSYEIYNPIVFPSSVGVAPSASPPDDLQFAIAPSHTLPT